ncbi:MAG: hypothetical protein DRN12_07370, partial [Thermoplasmata archaeon]
TGLAFSSPPDASKIRREFKILDSVHITSKKIYHPIQSILKNTDFSSTGSIFTVPDRIIFSAMSDKNVLKRKEERESLNIQ